MMVISNSELTTPTTSYANSGGTGDRTASITVSSSVTPDGGTIDNLVDGSTSFGSSTAIDMPGTGSTAIPDGAYFRFDFASKKYIDEVKIYFSTGANMGAWVIEGSDTSGSGYTVYGSFTWDSDTKTVTCTGVPAEGHRYWQMRKNGAGTNYTNNWFTEVEFKIAAGAV